MESVQKKRRASPPRWFWLLAVWLLLMALVIARLAVLSVEEEIPETTSTEVSLKDRPTDEVVSITIKRADTPLWTAVQDKAGILTIQGEDGFSLSSTDSMSLLEAAAHIVADSVLTEDPADYANLAEFGLDAPKYVARILYLDGSTLELSVGSEGHDGAWFYMTLVGDDRLFAFSRGAVESLFPNRDTLLEFTQPVLHKARLDEITLAGPEGIQAQWTLQSAITDADVIDRWQITAPFTYPADATAMTNLLTNIANIRLGAYVCEATPEALAAYGFDSPRLTITLHMAAGTIGNINAQGVYETADWPEGTLTYVIGGEKSDMVDYVLHDGHIYISSHFTLGLFMDYDVKATMSRYLTPVALGNLAALSIQTGDTRVEYAITRTEQVAENNALVTDESGSVVYDITLSRNGEPADYAAFEAAYSRLLPVSVSGTLPQTVEEAPHTVYTFQDVDGTVHTVSFTTFDAMHDAVSINGHQAFYLIKGGYALE